MQKELLAKFKEAHGDVPLWNAKKKLSVKTKVSPAAKPKKAPALKTTRVAPKVIASSVTKPVPKSKIVRKKPAAKEETPSQSGISKQSGNCRKAEKAKSDAIFNKTNDYLS